MQIFVWFQRGSELTIDINENATLADLASNFESKYGYKTNSFKYYFKGKQIDWSNNKRSLQSLQIEDHSTIHALSIPTRPPAKELKEMQSITEFFERLDQTKDKYESEDIRFFKAQSCHEPIEDKPVPIKYEIKSGLNEEWTKTIKRVIKHISNAVPGIRFREDKNDSSKSDNSKNNCKIKYYLKSLDGELTSENIYTQNICCVFVPEECKNKKICAAIKQTMSILGFPSKEIQNQNKKDSIVKQKNKYTIETFQKSILFGSLSKIVAAKRNEGNNYLSIQQQVLLNIVYPPAIRSFYNPKIGKTGLFYCKKSFTIKINH